MTDLERKLPRQGTKAFIEEEHMEKNALTVDEEGRAKVIFQSGAKTLDLDQIVFDGQQSDERVLFTVVPHFLKQIVWSLTPILLAFLLVKGGHYLAISYPALELEYDIILRAYGLAIAVLVLGLWWVHEAIKRTRTYITDRRIIRFGIVFPLFRVKRALLWNEVLKAKARPSNIIFRILKIYTLIVRANATDEEDIKVSYTYYCEDLVNYIDKILFYFNNKPDQIDDVRPFIMKPKGQRY